MGLTLSLSAIRMHVSELYISYVVVAKSAAARRRLYKSRRAWQDRRQKKAPFNPKELEKQMNATFARVY